MSTVPEVPGTVTGSRRARHGFASSAVVACSTWPSPRGAFVPHAPLLVSKHHGGECGRLFEADSGVGAQSGLVPDVRVERDDRGDVAAADLRDCGHAGGGETLTA